MRCIALCCLLFLIHLHHSAALVGSYSNCMWLQGPPAMYKLWWNIVDDKEIHIAIQANTTGWLALGFNHFGSMDGNGKGTDINLGYLWPSENGSLVPHINDYWTTRRDLPQKDPKQNLQLVAGYQSDDGITTIEYIRPLVTGDTDRDINIIPSHTMYVLWAVSTRKPNNEEGTIFSKHVWRGSKALRFAVRSTCSDDPPTNDDESQGNRFTNNDGTYSVTWDMNLLDRVATFTLTAKTAGWVGFGLSDSPNMPNSDVVVGWVDDNTHEAVLFDMWVGPDRQQPRTDVSLGGTNDVQLLSATQKEADDGTIITTISFKRNFSTGDKYDMDLADRSYYVLWAIGSQDGNAQTETFPVHISKGIFKVNFMTSALEKDVPIEVVIPHTPLRTFHGVMMMVAWLLLVPPGIFVARYVKPHSDSWWPAHVALQVSGILAFIVAFALICWELGFKSTHFRNIHGIIGLSVIILAVLQAILGLVAHCMYQPFRAAPPFFPDKLHWIIGRLLLVVAVVNIFTGLYYYNILPVPSVLKSMDPLQAFLGVSIGLLLCSWLVLCVIFFMVAECKYPPPKSSKRQSYYEDEIEDLLSPSSMDEATMPTWTESLDFIPAKPKKASSRKKLFVGFAIIHVIVLALAIAFLAAVPNDEPKLPYQLCPDCVIKTIHYDKFHIPIGYHDEPNVNNATTYVCRKFDLGTEATYYIVEMEVIVDNPQVLHHLVVFSIPDNYPAPDNEYFPCLMPDDAAPIFIWAPGMSSLRLPANVGMRAGKTPEGADSPSIRYVLLQVHYDNPSLDPDQYDSSGVRFYMTPKMVTHEAGILSTVVIQTTISIPPRRNETQVWGYCPSNQTSHFPHPLHVFASNPHAHKYARKVWTEHWRDGKRIDVINPHANFDFNDQKLYYIDKVIQPGDELYMHCIYDTSDTDQTVVGGDSTADEMCLNNLLYYPKMKYIACGSDAFYTPTDFRPPD